MEKVYFEIGQKGVILENSGDIVDNIDIEENVDTLVLGLNDDDIDYDFRKVDKTFPNVTKLLILPNVKTININNSMFPNVRHIASYSKNFKTGNMLVDKSMTLLNSFCLKEDEILDLSDIKEIEDYALDGCNAKTLIGNKSECVESVCIKLSEHSMSGSIYEKEPFVNGVKSYDNFVIDIDTNEKNVVFEDKHKFFNYFMKDFYLDTITIKNNSSHILTQLLLMKNSINGFKFYCKRLIIDTEVSLNKSDLNHLVDNFKLEYLELSDKVVNMSSIDGVVYSKDKETLIMVPKYRTEPLNIPEGVTEIRNFACSHTNIEYVSFPSSIRKVGNKAFRCSLIKTAHFNKNKNIYVEFKAQAFSECSNLEEIILPYMLYIPSRAFYECKKLKHVEFQEDVLEIDENAFNLCNSLEEIDIPSTVEIIKNGNFEHASMIHLKNKNVLFSVLRVKPIYLFIKNKHFYVIDLNGKYIFVPENLSTFRKNEISNSIDEGVFTKFYLKSNSLIDKIETAVFEYMHYKEQDTKDFIRRCSKVFTKECLESWDKAPDKFETLLINMFDNDLLTKASVELIKDFAEEEGYTSILAYCLNSTQSMKKSSFTL